MRKNILISISAIALLAMAFAGSGIKKNLSKSNEALRTPEQNYRTYCAGCHGENLEKFAAKQWMNDESPESVVNSIRYGLTDNGMPAFEKTFSDAEIAALAAFVKKGIPADREILKPAITGDKIVKSAVQKFIVDTVVTGLQVPWGLAVFPNGDMLISERAGTLHLFSKGKLSPPIEGVPDVMAFSQSGLMDLALHPDYKNNGWIYLSYTAPDPNSIIRKGNTAIMRARLNGLKLVDQEVLFQGQPYTTRGHHVGCKLAFDGKGHLYFGIGDRGQHYDFPQKTDTHNGKIHRINDDGSIPADNPFFNTPGAMPSIYSYGHRNPQGTAIHPETGEIWETEHGPRGGDELNHIRPGLNYGWPEISYGINYDGTILTEHTTKDGLEQPVYYWIPSIAPCGMCFVTGDRYKNWKNNLMVGSLRFGYVERMVLNGHRMVEREELLKGIGRVRNVVMGPDGLLYVSVENPGKIVRLIPVED